MSETTLLPDPEILNLHTIAVSESSITMIVKSIQPSAAYPCRQSLSKSVHSNYERTVADLPWQGVGVQLKLQVRRFFCSNRRCERAIFCERLPAVVAPYARKSVRLNDALRIIGFALGGEAGARLALELGMGTSPDTLIRRIRNAELSEGPTPRVLGVDDWATRKGCRYGTLLVDLEKHRVVEMLPDRKASTLADWLKVHPGVEVISRDRGGTYAEGASEGAPDAVQVADRWHLLKNLGTALERFAARHSEQLKQATKSVVEARLGNPSPALELATRSMLLDTVDNRESKERRQKRYERYRKVMQLYNQGTPQNAIAEQLGMDRVTVNTYVHSEGFPERSVHHSSQRSILESYIPYIHHRWSQGCHNARQLWREIKERGYPGKDRMVRRYALNLRKMLAELSPEEQANFLGTNPSSLKTPSARRASWWLAKPEKELRPEQRAFVEHLCRASPEAQKARELALAFKEMVTERRAGRLDGWLKAASESGVRELESFARTLNWDYDAVAAALVYEWSQGQVEGQVNKLKLIKRSMYGRANFDLLRARVLHAA